MSIVTAVKCDFCIETGRYRLFELPDYLINPVGGEFHICKTCMQRAPTAAERIRYLNVAIVWDEAHPSYIQEKTEIAISTMTLDFLLGSLDINKQREFIEQM